MNLEIKTKRYKKHIMEIKFLRSELSYQEEVLSTAHYDFDNYYKKWCEENNINLEELNQKHENRVSKILSQPNFPDLNSKEPALIPLSDEKKQEKKKFQNLFKQIAKVTHPDKNEGTMLDFKAASSAFEQGDWSMLLQIAEEYGITPEDLEEVLPIMKEEANKLRTKIENNKGMYSWKFHECDSDQCKENLIKKFLKHLFKVEI